MANINHKEADYLSKLQDYYADWKNIPSYARLCEIFGIHSKSHVKNILEKLMNAGLIERTPDGAWIPCRQFFARPLADASVRAGIPMGVEASSSDYQLIDDMLIDSPSKTVLIPVKGDSMLEAGIHDGDIAVVEKRYTATPGDIVVAIVDNEFTLKTLDKENGRYILRPANKAFAVIRPQGELTIFGVLTGLVRKYGA